MRENIRQIGENGDTSVLVNHLENTEKFADLVPPRQGLIGETGSAGTCMNNPDLAENGKVRRHPGIKGSEGGLNPAIHDWDGPVGQVIITRIA